MLLFFMIYLIYMMWAEVYFVMLLVHILVWD